MNIHLPAILMFTRVQGFDTLPYEPLTFQQCFACLVLSNVSFVCHPSFRWSVVIRPILFGIEITCTVSCTRFFCFRMTSQKLLRSLSLRALQMTTEAHLRLPEATQTWRQGLWGARPSASTGWWWWCRWCRCRWCSLSLSLSIARKDAHFDFTEPLAATRCNKFVSTGRSSSPQSPQSPQPMDEEERLKRPQFRGCCAASARVYKRCSPMCWLAASCNHLNFLVKPLPWWLFSPFWHIFYIFFIWMYHMAIDSIDP